MKPLCARTLPRRMNQTASASETSVHTESRWITEKLPLPRPSSQNDDTATATIRPTQMRPSSLCDAVPLRRMSTAAPMRRQAIAADKWSAIMIAPRVAC
jgi:hypothetical protein